MLGSLRKHDITRWINIYILQLNIIFVPGCVNHKKRTDRRGQHENWVRKSGFQV